MSKKAKKEMTMDRLAEMVAHGFEQVDQRFEQVDQRFEQVDQKLAQVATKSELAIVEQHLTTRLDRIEHLLLREHLNRIEKLEDDMRVLKTRLKVA